MSFQPVMVSSTGMVNGVGFDEASASAAIICGVNNFQETRFKDAQGSWIVASQPPLPSYSSFAARHAELLAMVLDQTFTKIDFTRPEKIPVLVCFSERDRFGRDPELNEEVLEQVNELLEDPVSAGSMTISQGRVGGIVAIREARRLLYEEGAPAVIVAGVDSYVQRSLLHHLGGQRRLLTEANSDGFVPGEAAAAVVLQKPIESQEPRVILRGIGFGLEQATIDSDLPLRADGLVAAVDGALKDARMDMSAVEFRITDSSGEQYWFKEAGLVLARVMRVRKEEFDYWHTADCIGEVGAASGPSILGLACRAFETGFAKGDAVLCHFGNDDGKRAAAVLSFEPVRAYVQ